MSGRANFDQTNNATHPDRYCAHCKNEGRVPLDQELPSCTAAYPGEHVPRWMLHADDPCDGEHTCIPKSASVACPMCTMGAGIDAEDGFWARNDFRDYSWHGVLTAHHWICGSCMRWTFANPRRDHNCEALAKQEQGAAIEALGKLARLTGRPARSPEDAMRVLEGALLRGKMRPKAERDAIAERKRREQARLDAAYERRVREDRLGA